MGVDSRTPLKNQFVTDSTPQRGNSGIKRDSISSRSADAISQEWNRQSRNGSFNFHWSIRGVPTDAPNYSMNGKMDWESRRVKAGKPAKWVDERPVREPRVVRQAKEIEALRDEMDKAISAKSKGQFEQFLSIMAEKGELAARRETKISATEIRAQSQHEEWFSNEYSELRALKALEVEQALQERAVKDSDTAAKIFLQANDDRYNPVQRVENTDTVKILHVNPDDY